MLSVLCLSLVPVLRCVALKRIEFLALLIPPSVELLFSVALLLKRDSTRGRYHYLLCAEGISYFLLALTEFLSHTIPFLYQDLSVFKLVDIIIGGSSFIPVLCFTLWFYFTARQELIHKIPTRIRKPTKYILIGCIPLVTIFNAIGAFIGISYRTLDGAIAVGFIDGRARLLWSLFSMLSLALLAVFEAVASLLLLARLTKVIRHKRRRDSMDGTGEVHHPQGIILMNIGMFLSLAETLVGFVRQSFVLGITRRGTKTAGRILIILGLLKGWDYLEGIRFVLQEPPRSKRVSRLSIRQLFPSTHSSSGESQTSERRRVSVRYPRGRAPMLHLRLSSKFDINPVTRTLRSPAHSPNSLRTHLISETTPTRSTIEKAGEGHLDIRYPRYRNFPSGIPASPVTPTTPQTIIGPTSILSSVSDRTVGPRLSAPTQDEPLHHPSHTRESTMSSTLSNIQMEVMTLSGSPPDPGFVLPIPSRSRGRQNFGLSLADTAHSMDLCSYPTHPGGADLGYTSLQRLGYPEDTPVGYGDRQLDQATPPASEIGITFSPSDSPEQREFSWASESSGVLSAVITTAARLTRANTSVSVTSVAARPTPATASDDNRQQGTLTTEHLIGDHLSVAHTGHSGGSTV